MKRCLSPRPLFGGALLALTLALPALAEAQQQAGRSYAPGPFTRLEISGAADVRLLQGERDEVFIAGGEEVQKSVELELRRGRLEIQPTGGWKFWRSARLQIEVTVKQLEQLELSGASDLHAPGPFRAERLTIGISGAGLVRFDDLQAETLRFGISGAGDGQLRGQVRALALSVSGKGKLMAEQLRTDTAAVTISGVGNAALWVTQNLRVNVSGVGTVDYWGRPQVSRSSSGMATINARGDAPAAN
ncbi:DUF2807 domain-containing protein [Roseateles sp. DAIF2]|uniref:head GIN domain-containing protein n=1 Tax=Roseateles sp. DAIF2 TaxID=2714952 RepID=UPI0018A26A28|nr:head GIN domain-containing protein [Roseateles sp. DAIF2]QPF76047.1 DUF2807 domain-containing protein [Roseateles sp. DAIF2]